MTARRNSELHDTESSIAVTQLRVGRLDARPPATQGFEHQAHAEVAAFVEVGSSGSASDASAELTSPLPEMLDRGAQFPVCTPSMVPGCSVRTILSARAES